MDTELYRRNVGIAVFNHQGQIFLAERKDRRNAWQTPQGGLDADEEPWQGALRELEEEIGTRTVEYLGEIDVWLRYKFPSNVENHPFKGRYVGQEQKWFAVRFLGQDSDIDLEASPHPEFCAWRWADLADIPSLVVDFKREIYEEVVKQFTRFAAAV